MLKLLISLVFLFIIQFTKPVFSLINEALIPKPKPETILNITKKRSDQILPQKKPFNLVINNSKEVFLFPKTKPSKNSLNKIIVEDKFKPQKPLIDEINGKKLTRLPKNIELQEDKKIELVFLLPEKKPFTYKKVIEKEASTSEILSKRDFKIAKEVFVLINQKKWKSALKSTKRIKDKDFKNLINWLYLKEKTNSASFSEYAKFIEQNPNYPRLNRLKYLAEHKINLQNISPSTIIGWFDAEPPLSGYGEIKLGESFLKKGRIEEGSEFIKKGWITASLSSKDLRYYNKKYKKIISSSDHIKRAEYMSWENKYWDLKRILRYLPKDQRALYNARQILMSSSYGVDKAISDVPEILKSDIGLRYNRLKWRRRRGRIESSLEILNAAPNNNKELIRADLWWKERQVISRSLIYKKKFEMAYNVAKNHSLNKEDEKESAAYAEAEWMAGWIALSFLDDPKTSLYHFNNFYKNVGYPISLARGGYWLGVSYEKIGDTNLSEKYFKEASKFLTTFYGQLAHQKIYPTQLFELKDDAKFSDEFKKKFYKNPLTKHVKVLKELNKTSLSKDLLKHLADLDIEKGSEVLAAELAVDIGRYDYAIQISKKASYEKRFYNKYNYPIINTPELINGKPMPSQEIILAITRQESEFDPKANSYAGAKGMMQLMSYTAKLVSKEMNVGYSTSRLTSDPDYNIRLGTYYFNSLINNYGEIYPFAIAAYNAGPKRVKYWRKINGDPSKNKIDYVNWIELIKFKETRNYVQRVLENANVYRYMLRQKPIELKKYFDH